MLLLKWLVKIFWYVEKQNSIIQMKTTNLHYKWLAPMVTALPMKKKILTGDCTTEFLWTTFIDSCMCYTYCNCFLGCCCFLGIYLKSLVTKKGIHWNININDSHIIESFENHGKVQWIKVASFNETKSFDFPYVNYSQYYFICSTKPCF